MPYMVSNNPFVVLFLLSSVCSSDFMIAPVICPFFVGEKIMNGMNPKNDDTWMPCIQLMLFHLSTLMLRFPKPKIDRVNH